MTVKNHKEISQQLTELVNKYASDELKSNDRYYDILTNVCSIWENTDLVWRKFKHKSKEYKETILNEKLTLEFLELYVRTRGEVNFYHFFENHIYFNRGDIGLIFHNFFHYLVSIHNDNIAIINAVLKITHIQFKDFKHYANGHMGEDRFNIFSNISTNLKSNIPFIEEILNTINIDSNDDKHQILMNVFLLKDCLRSLDFTKEYELIQRLNSKIHQTYLQYPTYFRTNDDEQYLLDGTKEQEEYINYIRKQKLYEELVIEILPNKPSNKPKMKI